MSTAPMPKPICQRCEGRGYIRECVLRLDDVEPGEPQTATVIEVLEPRLCPECGGKVLIT